MRVLVTGASGFVGSNLLPALVEAGHDVVAMTRNAADYSPPVEVAVVEGDLLAPGTLSDVFEGIDAAYYLVHSLQTGDDFTEQDRRAATNFAAATSAAGVERVVYLGGLGETGDDLSAHLRSRQEVEDLLGRGSYDLTTLRAAIIIGAGSRSFDMIYQLTRKLPVMLAPKWVYTDCQPIGISDVVTYLVGVLDEPETAGETYEIGGPEVLTLREIAKLVRGSVAVVPVPMGLAGVGLKVAGAIPGFPMGGDQYRSLTFDNTTSDNDIGAFGVDPADLTTLEAYLRNRT